MHVDVGALVLGGGELDGAVAGAVGCTGAEVVADVVGAAGEVEALDGGALAECVAGALLVAGGVARSLPLVIICLVGIGRSGLFAR